jgi:hydroxymethylpyrimidine/phosphomethylpyrimidine kinase
VVLDPVMVATSGARLLEDSALQAMRERLIPLATLITPNTPEAELLVGRKIGNGDDAEQAASALLDLGAGAVPAQGWPSAEGNRVIDRYFDGVSSEEFIHARLPLDAHGTGCTPGLGHRRATVQRPEPGQCLRSRHRLRCTRPAAGLCPGRSEVLVLDHFGAAPHA